MMPFPGNEKKKKERDISTFVEHVHKIMAFFMAQNYGWYSYSLLGFIKNRLYTLNCL